MLSGKRLDEEESARAFEVIYKNACAQNQPISELLDVSRIITSKLRFDARLIAFVTCACSWWMTSLTRAIC